MPSKQQLMDQFRDAFHRFDVDGTGRLNREELAQMMGTVDIQPDPKQVECLFNFMDIDRSGSVDLGEFADAMVQLEHLCFGFSLMRIRFLFTRYDVDNSGVITKENLVHLTKTDATFDVDEATMDNFMKKCDIDGDGRISFDEFAKVMGSEGSI